MRCHAPAARLMFAASLAAVLAACSAGEDAPAPDTSESAAPPATSAGTAATTDALPGSGASPAAAAAAGPPASFARCAICHTVDKGGANRIGPNLWGTYGKSAGVHAGFAYSDALKTSGLVWNDATLDKWLEYPPALVPGNRMSFTGLNDAAKRQEIIDYLKTLR